MKNMQLIVNYKPIQFKLDFGAEVNVLTKKLLEQSYTQDTRESKLKLSDATF